MTVAKLRPRHGLPGSAPAAACRHAPQPQLPLKDTFVLIACSRPQLPLNDTLFLIDMAQPQLPLAEATPEDMTIAATMAAQRRATRIFLIVIGG